MHSHCQTMWGEQLTWEAEDPQVKERTFNTRQVYDSIEVKSPGTNQAWVSCCSSFLSSLLPCPTREGWDTRAGKTKEKEKSPVRRKKKSSVIVFPLAMGRAKKWAWGRSLIFNSGSVWGFNLLVLDISIIKLRFLWLSYWRTICIISMQPEKSSLSMGREHDSLTSKLKGTVNDKNKTILEFHLRSPAFQPNTLEELTR